MHTGVECTRKIDKYHKSRIYRGTVEWNDVITIRNIAVQSIEENESSDDRSGDDL